MDSGLRYQTYQAGVGTMTAQEAINAAYIRLGIESLFRTDDGCWHRIGTTNVASLYYGDTTATVYVCDHRQGRGESVTIGQADPNDLDVRVSTRKRIVERQHVAAVDLADTIRTLLREAV